MTDEFVVDTNVPRAANGDATHAGISCQIACIEELQRIIADCRVMLDASGLILDEYSRRLSFAGGPGVGDYFFRTVWDAQGDEQRVRQVPITPDVQGVFEEFPADGELSGFDHDDRKFVATAIAGGRLAQIVNAVDSDWWHYELALARHEIFIRHLCQYPKEQTR